VGALGGKERQLVGKVGDWYVENRYLRASIERTDCMLMLWAQ
jgi:hypothetical protein